MPKPKRDEYQRPRTHKEFLDFLDEEDEKAMPGYLERRKKKKKKAKLGEMFRKSKMKY